MFQSPEDLARKLSDHLTMVAKRLRAIELSNAQKTTGPYPMPPLRPRLVDSVEKQLVRSRATFAPRCNSNNGGEGH